MGSTICLNQIVHCDLAVLLPIKTYKELAQMNDIKNKIINCENVNYNDNAYLKMTAIK